MNRVAVQAQVTVYEDDNSATWGDSAWRVIVESHWNDPDAVVLVINGKHYTVIARDLRAALDAATVNR